MKIQAIVEETFLYVVELEVPDDQDFREGAHVNRFYPESIDPDDEVATWTFRQWEDDDGYKRGWVDRMWNWRWDGTPVKDCYLKERSSHMEVSQVKEEVAS